MRRVFLKLLENQEHPFSPIYGGYPPSHTFPQPKKTSWKRTALKVGLLAAALGGAGYYAHKKISPLISSVASTARRIKHKGAKGVANIRNILTITPLDPEKRDKAVAQGKDIMAKLQTAVTRSQPKPENPSQPNPENPSQPKPKNPSTREQKKERLAKKLPGFMHKILNLMASQRNSRNLFSNLRENDFNPERMYFEEPQHYQHPSPPPPPTYEGRGYPSPHYGQSYQQPKSPSVLRKIGRAALTYAAGAGTAGALGGALAKYHNTRERVLSKMKDLSQGKGLTPEAHDKLVKMHTQDPNIQKAKDRGAFKNRPDLLQNIAFNRMKQRAFTSSGAWEGAKDAITSPVEAAKNLVKQLGRINWKKGEK